MNKNSTNTFTQKKFQKGDAFNSLKMEALELVNDWDLFQEEQGKEKYLECVNSIVEKSQ